ncbi:MAG: sulfatase [Anaerolineae bacterium]
MNVIVILCDTLRRDHCGPYHHGRPLNECWSREAPDWVVPTPNIDRLAERGTVFDQCYCGSTPCMPARRDIYTGRYEFLERGWGPLEEEDFDLPRQVSGPPNRSVQWSVSEGYRVSYLITDHFHLWEQGSGNYHMGYTGFDFVRGCEADALYTAPKTSFRCPEGDHLTKNERHWRNVHHIRQSDEDYFCAQVVQKAMGWLERNHALYEDFYLHLDIFDPHEPWDPPEDILKRFDPRGYDVTDMTAAPPYDKWRDVLTESQFRAYRARYAAKVVFLDRWLGHLLDTLDRLDLWKETLVILTTDHATFNGDHGRIGKLQTHEFDAVGHIPFIAAHPEAGQGERRSQLVQLVDLYPTVLAAVDRPLPDFPEDRPLHGVDLLSVLKDASTATRDYAIYGQFGKSVSITDGTWVLHQSPVPVNRPLYWYGYCLSKFLNYDLGPYAQGRRPVIDCESWQESTWLSHKLSDMNELKNLAMEEPEQLRRMQRALRGELLRARAPIEQIDRLGLRVI